MDENLKVYTAPDFAYSAPAWSPAQQTALPGDASYVTPLPAPNVLPMAGAASPTETGNMGYAAILAALMHMISQGGAKTGNQAQASPQGSAPNPVPHMDGSEYNIPSWMSGGLNFGNMGKSAGNKPDYTVPKPDDKKSGGGGGFDIGSMFGGI